MPNNISASFLSIHLRCYLCEMWVAPQDRCTHATDQIDQEHYRHSAGPLVRKSVLGHRFSRLGVKVTPTGRKVFIVLYRTGGAGSEDCGSIPWGLQWVTLPSGPCGRSKGVRGQPQDAIQQLRKRRSKCRAVADGIGDLLESFVIQRLAPKSFCRRELVETL